MRVVLALALVLVLAPAAHAVRWSAPQTAATDALTGTQLEMDANARGDAVISYLEREGDQPFSASLNVVRRDASGELAPPQTLTRMMWHAWNVAVGPDGRAYAVWLDESDPEGSDVDMTIMFAEAAPGQPFGPPRAIASLFGDWPTLIHVAETAGQLVIAFPYRGVMRVLTRVPGQDFAAPVEFPEIWGHGALGVNDRGDAVVAWYRARQGVFGVSFRDGRAGAVQLLGPARTAGNLRLGLGAGGSILATWHATLDEDAEADRHYGAIEGAAARLGAPGRGFDVAPAPESTRAGPQKPELAVAGDGSGVVAWHHVHRPENVRYATKGRVHAARLSASGRRGRPRPLSSARAVATEPRVATDARGRTAVVWQQVPRDSLSRPLRLMAATAARGRRFGTARAVVTPRERAQAHALAAHRRGFLLAYVRKRDRTRATLAIRSGR